MPIRKGSANWKGTLKEGAGTISVESGTLEAPYNFGSRFENGVGTNPEGLIAAAHAGCFSMAFSLLLSEAGYTADNIQTSARVHLEKKGKGFEITQIELSTEGEVPGIDQKTFQEQAEKAKKNCPVSKALQGPEISLRAKLL
jgi:osmotically inducible protein OsmC